MRRNGSRAQSGLDIGEKSALRLSKESPGKTGGAEAEVMSLRLVLSVTCEAGEKVSAGMDRKVVLGLKTGRQVGWLGNGRERSTE